MIAQERRIVTRLVEDVKAAGYVIGIRQDGYVDTPHPNSVEDILGELGQASVDELFLFEADKSYAGSVVLTYQAPNLIADYSFYLMDVVKGAEALEASLRDA